MTAAAVIAAATWYRGVTLPQPDLDLTYQSAAIRIERDDFGAPAIQARSEAAALFGLGVAHAQDRLWQMDFNRRVAQGRLSEVLGAKTIEADRFLRTLGMYRRAERLAADLDPATGALLDAYIAGINHVIAAAAPRPPEFLLTGAPSPARWTRADSMSWMLLMAWDLSAQSHRNELTRMRLAQRLDLDSIDDLRPPYPGDPRAETANYVELYRLLGVGASKASDAARQPNKARSNAAIMHGLALGAGEGIGSNNWVVSGAHTRSGRPMLANDPHLGLYAPSTWYVARMSAPGIEVAGATMPGVPYIIIGRNRHVAWGVTNTGPDVQDLYIERLRPDDRAQYQTPDGYQRFDERVETIDVKGQAPVAHTVRATRHGPVLSGLTPAIDQALASDAHVLSLRWTALEGQDFTLRAVRNMNRAANADEFIAALSDWTVVQQSFVFADVHGAIGMAAPGRVPVRRADNDLHGLAPAPGWDARYDWTGHIPFDDLPRVLNPPDGMLVTANHKITPPGYTPHLTHEWFLPYRAQRIESLLRARKDHTVETFAEIQADLTSLAARDLLAALKALQPSIAPDTAAGRLTLERLLAWDGAMRVDSPEPLLLHAWLRVLRERIFGDDLAEVAPDFVATNELTLPLLNVLRGAATARNWCDDQRTNRIETCAQMAQESLDAAVNDLAKTTGKDVLGLRWGDVHRAQIDHRPFSAVPVLRNLFGHELEVGGDSFTVNVAQLSLRAGAPYTTRHAASIRLIFDLAPDGVDRWIYPGGQSGNPLSPHYDDLLRRWQRVELLPFPPAPASGTTTAR